MKIAFIGLGNMGGSMAQNLLKSDHQVFGYDPSETALQHFAQAVVWFATVRKLPQNRQRSWSVCCPPPNMCVRFI